MIVYLVRNLAKGETITEIEAPFITKEKLFLVREKAIAQYNEWAPEDGYGFGKMLGVANRLGSRSISMAGDKGADIMQMEVIE